jgi:two-component system catabolic regulation response regulator CreB
VPTAPFFVEDDPAIAHTVVYALQREGFQVDHVLLLRDALQRLREPSARYAALIPPGVRALA